MQFELQIIVLLVAVSCAIPGVFLVLRKMSLMSDAISHALLPGIVIAFLLTESLNSPWLIIGAVIMGVVTVVLSEGLSKTGLLQNDAAIGIVFPALFSIGVIMVSLYAGNIHLDADAVLRGDPILSTLDRLEINSVDLGPKSIWVMGSIFLLNLVMLTLFFKELKLATFDKGLAASLGFSPGIIHYALMIDVSITAVGAFDAVGSILVVALMVAPAAAAYLLTNNLTKMVLLSIIIGALSAFSGFWIAWGVDGSIAGAMACMTGVFFLLAFFFSPSRGMVSILRRRQDQKLQFGIAMLTVHLMHHRHNKNAIVECSPHHLQDHINWETAFARRVVSQAGKQGLIREDGGMLLLTKDGENLASASIAG